MKRTTTTSNKSIDLNTHRQILFMVVLGLNLLMSVSSVCYALSGKYPIRNFTPDEYGAGIQNIDFAQNRDMNLFVANNLGVLSFNGNQWKTFARNTGKKQRSLAFDRVSSRLYVGSQGDFGYFTDQWTYVSLLEKVPENLRDFDEVWDVYSIGENVFFCTFQGIFRYDGQKISGITHKDGFERSFLVKSKLFTQTQKGEFFEVEGDNLIPLGRTTGKKKEVAGVVRNDTGYIVIYNSGEIELLNGSLSKTIFVDLANAVSRKYVNHVTQISDGRLVIATQQAGIFLYDMQTGDLENITVDGGLLSNACLRVFQDHAGNLWVGMQNGIALIDIRSPIRLINKNIGLEGSGYEAYETDAGTYYTTSNGIYFQPVGESESSFLNGTEGPAYGLNQINSKLYAGHHTGLFLLENEKATKVLSTAGIWQVKQLRSNPQYAIGGTYSGLYLFRLDGKGELVPVQMIEGFNESSRFFEEDVKGRIWVGQYYKGLYLVNLNQSLKEAEVVKISDSTKLPIQQYIFLSRVDDEIYICTTKGIFKLDQETDKIEEEEVFSKTIGSNWVYQFVQDKQKNVYVHSENSMALFKQVGPGNYATVPSSLFLVRQSFNNDLLSVSLNVKDGVLFNSNEGFISYNPELEDRVLLTKEPLVEKVISVVEDSVLYFQEPFGTRPEVFEPIRITEGTRVLQFIVESFFFGVVNNQSFRYRLSGFDKDFGTWTNSFVKEYTNLKVGTYEFEVQTFGSHGEIVNSKPLTVIVTPPFYRSIYAIICYVLLGLIVLYMFYRIQRQYYRGKQAELEQSRRLEIEKKQNELQQIKDEQLKSELQHLNTLLASSTMNLVVKNEFMENIKEEIRVATKTGKVEDKQAALERIFKEIDTTLKVNEDWKQFEYHFDRVHGDFLSRLTSEFRELTPGDQKLCAFLRLNMDTKEIANLMGISLRGVEVSRYRLRKKLGLDTHQNLSKFILEY